MKSILFYAFITDLEEVMGCNFIKSPSETKLSNHCAQEQCWVLGRLEEWVNQNVWKFKYK